LFLSSNNVETIADEIGATDYIIGGADGVGNIMLGGAGDDQLRGGSGDDVILGDGGRVYRDADFNVTRVETTSPSIGGADDIQGVATRAGPDRDVYSIDEAGGGVDHIVGGADGLGNVIIGGAEGDFISGGSGDDTILGDSGYVARAADGSLVQVRTTAPSIGGRDIIEGGAGTDVIMGGADGDVITAPTGGKIILGDNGVANFAGPDRDVYSDPDAAHIGGVDIITGGESEEGNIILGGAEGDQISGGAGDDVILGDNGYVQRAEDGSLIRVFTIAHGIGGEDHIEGGAGNDVIMGGAMGDFIHAPTGGKIILGDNGQANLAGPDRDVFSIAEDIGGVDYIVGGADGVGNIIIGGAYGDEITAGTGDDVILGDSGRVERRADETLVRVITTAPGIGGADNIRAGDGFDVVLGGADGDNIEAGTDA